jgi:polysaccharide deacetylase 2 family uncharacterized protein YibQ
MQWLMEEIHDRENLFFIDSYTHHESVALQIAYETGVSAAKRDVFLDPDRSPQTVAREFERISATLIPARSSCSKESCPGCSRKASSLSV